MTPLTNGKRRFIARDANSAFTRVPVDKLESKTAIVGATGAGCECEDGLCSGEEWPSLLPGKDIEGNEEVTSEGRSSHFCSLWRNFMKFTTRGIWSWARTYFGTSPETKSLASAGLGDESSETETVDVARLLCPLTVCQPGS
ncbi:proteophosphoglycan ppg4, partial [Moniliophthora roreri]